MPWNPDTYHKFQAERAAPFDDLVGLIEVRDGMRVIDLGCGTGELTARLAEMLPNSEVLGVDSSAAMLARAQPFATTHLRFEQRSIEEVIADASEQGAWDLVFSHAALQWVPDHEQLIPAVIGLGKGGGQIAVQIPSNHDHFTHRVVAEVAGLEPYRTGLDGWMRQSPVLGIERYAELVFECDAENIRVMEKVYPHVLENADAMADWTSGTLLVPYFERLPEDQKAGFDAVYRARLRERFPGSPVFYGFKRTLFAITIP